MNVTTLRARRSHDTTSLRGAIIKSSDSRQADIHRRAQDDVVVRQRVKERNALVMKLKPFVYLEDANLDTATLAEKVADRLKLWAVSERKRRLDLAQ